MLKYNVVEIKLSECHTVQRELPVWELPVLKVLHPETVVIGEKLVKRAAPEADDEFRRLAKRYHTGKPEDGSPEEVSFVAKVYGVFGNGTVALARAIADATVPDPVILPAPAEKGAEDLIGDLQVSSVGG